MLNHLAPLFIVGLAFAFLGWAVEVLSSRIERERRKRFPNPEPGPLPRWVPSWLGRDLQ